MHFADASIPAAPQRSVSPPSPGKYLSTAAAHLFAFGRKKLPYNQISHRCALWNAVCFSFIESEWLWRGREWLFEALGNPPDQEFLTSLGELVIEVANPPQPWLPSDLLHLVPRPRWPPFVPVELAACQASC